MYTAMFGLLIVVVLGLLVARLVGRSTDQSGLSARERAELDGLRILVDDLKETAWDHRELDSALSVIIIDKIRDFERRARGQGS
jgi:hypothetical protein